jgi:hypothetical protein
MTDLFLRFTDEASAQPYLYDIEQQPYTDEDDVERHQEVLRAKYVNLDTLGVIYDGDQPLPGWHVNIRALDDEDIESLRQFQVFPTNPRRVWA